MFWIFFFYSIFGWILDSCYRSLTERAWKKGGFSPLPFAPSYGIAAVILLTFGSLISAYPLFFQWIILGIFLGAYEYLCGRIATSLLKRRLWDYSQNKFNIQGHTDLLHSIYWGTLAVFTLHWLHPWLMSLFAGLSAS